MDGKFVVSEEYKKSQTIEIAIKLLEYYLDNKDSYNRGLITYGDLCERLSFDMNPREIEKYLGEISFACKDNNLPPISALVVNKKEKMPGDGFFRAYCPKVKGDDRISEWLDIFNKIHAYHDWNRVLDTYKSL